MPTEVLYDLHPNEGYTDWQYGSSDLVAAVTLGTWSHLRVGLRCVVGDANTQTDISGPPLPRLAVGLCAGTTYPYRSNSCAHFVGAVTNHSTWYNVGTGPACYHCGGGATNALKSCKKIGTTLTGEPSGAAGPVISDGADQPATVIFVDIKRMTNPALGFNVTLFSRNASPLPSPLGSYVTKTKFDAAMLANPAVFPPGVASHSSVGPYNVYTSEATNGVLSAVNVSWNRSEQFGVRDVQVVKFA